MPRSPSPCKLTHQKSEHKHGHSKSSEQSDKEKHKKKKKTKVKGRSHPRSRSSSEDRFKSRNRSRSNSDEHQNRHFNRSHSRSRSKERKYEKKKHYEHKQEKHDREPHRKTVKKKKSKFENSSADEREDELRLLQRLEEERKKQQDERRQFKEVQKVLETPEEKRLRRLQKKEAKERRRKEKMGWDSEYLHFTNADNPYGDNNLLETFVWNKKLEKKGLHNLPREEIEKCNRAKMEENRLELEKVKKRRQERELERAEREHLMELEQRKREAAQFSEFSRQEDSFQLEQARIRSQIRIQDGRAKPIDLLAQYVSSEGDVTAVDMHEPYTHLTGLTLLDLEDLLEDIKVYQQLEKENENQSYWNDLTIIVQDELRRLHQRDSSTVEDATTQRQGIHAAVASDVSTVFQNKSVMELKKLQLNIEQKLAGPTTGVDVGYWESLLSQLKAHQARARLRERHRDNLRKKLEMLKAEQGVKEEHGNEQPDSDEEEESAIKEECEEKEEVEPTDEEEEVDCVDENEGNALLQTSLAAYTSGRFSPKLIPSESLDPGTVVVGETEDEQRLMWARQRVVGAGQAVESVLSAEEKAMQQEAQRAMTSDEAQFSVEARLEPQVYLWSDKYRPRKPRYFNRVHTGFEWNKYNQTHYDMDNPPPKIVQGYKFNIFYPDLIDKTKTPQYELIPCDDNKDFSLLKFTAGPPYEDIAFKIVNREWEYSYKRGFRCQFHNNIFQLWFHFKRYRYRR